MPYILSGGAGGGGLHFRRPFVDLYATTAVRSTHFTTDVPADYLDFVRDTSLAIVVGTLAAPVFYTYVGTAAAYDDTQWVERIDAVEGQEGPQGVFDVEEYINSATVPTLAGGGEYNLDTGVQTLTTGTTADPTTPAAGEDIYVRSASLNPKIDAGAVDLSSRWSAWVEHSHLSSIVTADVLDLGTGSQVGSRFDFPTPTGFSAQFRLSGQFVQFELGTIDSPDDSDVMIRVGTVDFELEEEFGRVVKLHELSDDTQYIAFGKAMRLTLVGREADVVDVTNVGLPAADAESAGKIFTNRRLPAAWIMHEVPHANTPVMGTFDTYVSARDSNDNFDLFQGPMAADFFTLRVGIADQTLDSRHVGLFYWNWRDHVFREWVQTFNQHTNTYSYHWQSAHNPGVLLGGTTGVYLGYDTLDSDLLRRMPQDQIDATRRYIGVATHGAGSDEFREFDNSSYVAAVAPFNVYDFVTIGLYGTGGNAGQTAGQVHATINAALNTLVNDIDGEGLTNSGTTLAPVLDVDPDQADFPTIPVDKGGTGATDAAAARTALGIIASYIKTQYEANADTNAFTDVLLTKVNSVETSAKDDQTGAEIVTLLQALTGNAQLDAAALRLLADALDTELGQTDWRTGGSGGFTLRVGAGAPDDTLGDDDDWYINATTGGFSEKVSGAWELRYTDQVGAGGGLTESQVDARVDALALRQAQNLADLDSASTARTNLGLGTAAVLDSGTGSGNLPVLDADGRLVVARLPSAVQNAIRSLSYSTAQPQRLGYTEVDGSQSFITLSRLAALTGATFTGAVIGVTPTDADHLTRMDYVDDADALRAQLAGAVFTGQAQGIEPTDDADFVTLHYFHANTSGGQVPPDDHVLRVGWSADATFVDAELTADSTTYTVTIPNRPVGNLNPAGYLAFWIKDQSGAAHTPADVRYGGHAQSQIGSYEDPIAYEYSGEDGHLWVTTFLQDFNLEGDSLEVIF